MIETGLMNAAVVTAPGSVAVRQVPLPEPGPGHVRVRLQGSGVCASNLTPCRSQTRCPIGCSWAYPSWL